MDKVSYVLPMMVTIQAEDPKEVMRRLNIALRDCVKDECGYPSLTYDDVYIYGMDLPNFCEDCGVDMRTANEEGD